MELEEFFAARLDEDEAAAKAAAEDANGGTWELDAKDGYEEFSGSVKAVGGYGVVPAEPPAGNHIARHDPDRVLLDIEADRELLIKYEIAKALQAGQYKLGYCEAIEEVIALRAARFSRHPDYRAGWAPPAITRELRSAITKARHSSR